MTALALCFYFGSPIDAQSAPSGISDNSDAIIASPQPVKHYSGPLPKTIEGISDVQEKFLQSSIQNLQENFGILYDINSQSNQKALDSLGKNYASIPQFGTHFQNTVSAINPNELTHNTDIFAKNASETIRTFKDLPGLMAVTAVKAIVKYSQETGYTQKNQPPASEIPHLQALRDQEAEKMRPLLQDRGKQNLLLSRLIGRFDTLNANIASINQTYLNLIKLTEKQPSYLLSIPTLSKSIASMDDLATSSLKSLTSLNASLAEINHLYDVIKRDQGDDITEDQSNELLEARRNLTIGLEKFTDTISSANSGMALTLGNVPSDPSYSENLFKSPMPGQDSNR